MKYILVIVIFFSILACQPEEEKLTLNSLASLRFSSDTVFFDTIFSQVNKNIRNITKRLKVYNDDERAIEIKSISLSSDSPYTIFVNGKAGSSFNNVRLLGGDSLLILVEVIIDPQNTNLPFIVTDEISFATNNNSQQVKLVAWGQDAHFLKDSVLACNTVWSNDRPYVIFNSILIDSLCSLTIEPGTEVYSHNGSYIFVKGSLHVLGEAENRVRLRNDRRDFEHTPGQWGGIVFLPGSKDNRIAFTDIRNAEVGIYLGTPDKDTIPDLTLANVTIENMGGNTEVPVNGGIVFPGYGVLAISSDLYAYNTLINNCEVNTLGNYGGGHYRYEHCTFANFSFDFFRENPSVVFSDNLVLDESNVLVGDLYVTLFNTIIWGSLQDELLLSKSGESVFSLSMSHNLLRTNSPGLEVNGNILNEDPIFRDPRDYDYRLDTLSPAKDKGIDLGITQDHNGQQRDSLPDIGAFERIEN